MSPSEDTPCHGHRVGLGAEKNVDNHETQDISRTEAVKRVPVVSNELGIA